MELTLTDDPERSRFEIHRGDQLAGVVEYRLDDDEITLLHTEIGREFGGQGVAGTLVRGVLDVARCRALTVVPECDYVRNWISKHPGYADVVTAVQRRR
ncbi:GNAT family N-acetyltransferase [Pseudonocardia abyssalis]|uniref:N-acetyltransferase n=1 Tax=Pseudonocardia abyssalis TaxID=2792008 RepID=A0ABS6URC2_9PSEU|nr:GNAT family N-acetyltransferase [Pseudonocardia abyssalis]MBW0113726.1 N-acetyltransferase [Pseudonocardia abyssalis]MBW0134799.1 N-acetyltransferase [Pseudonocardia abyssalis]